MLSKETCMHASLFLAWLIALIATLFSLYSSEVLGMTVCHLCWYQRICLYPLVWILGVAAFRGDAQVIPAVILSPILSFFLGSYQYLEQMIPGFSPIKLCTMDGDCSIIHFQWLGFITYPLLSVFASVLIALLLWVAYVCRWSKSCL